MATPSWWTELPENPCSWLSKGVIPRGAYSFKPPMPPTFDAPASRLCLFGRAMELVPSQEHKDCSQLTSEDFEIITRNSKLIYNDDTKWIYEDRHSAQAIADFLYLGPTSTIRNREFLTGHGFTMMVVVRDARMLGRVRSVDQASRELNIAVQYVRVGSLADLIHALPDIIRLMNHHLLSIHHAQSRGPGDRRRGRILVTCDTGNGFSAAIVVAYLISVLGQKTVSAVQFVHLKRISCAFDEDVKRMLQSWEDIVRARSMTARAAQPHVQGQAFAQNADEKAQPAGGELSRRKRAFDDMVDLDRDVAVGAGNADDDRFADREPFAPFIDMPDDWDSWTPAMVAEKIWKQ